MLKHLWLYMTFINTRKQAYFWAFIVFLLAMLCNLVVTTIARQGLLSALQDQLRGLAGTAAAWTDGDLHQTLIKAEQKGSEDYQKVQQPYRRMLKANPQLRYIYTCILKDGKVYFITDTQQPKIENLKLKADERDTTANVMEEYKDFTPVLMRALKEQKLVIEDQPYTDEWGTVISAYAPFYNSKKEFIGIVGNDIDAADFNARMQYIWIAFSVGAVFSTLLSAFVFWIVWHIRSIHAIEDRTKLARLTAMHTFTEQMKKVSGRVAIASQDINIRAQTISQMATQSRTKTDEARNQIRGAGDRIASIGLICRQMVASADKLFSEAKISEKTFSEAAEKFQQLNISADNLLETTNNISQILPIIQEITERIDLLALNATIEAARAGEAGKSFAVVAGEIKLLSYQTAQATHKIADYLSSLKKVSGGLMTDFSEMSQKILSVSAHVTDTTQTVEEQKEFISLIDHDVASVTNSAFIVENSVGAVAEMAQKTEEQTRNLYTAVNILSRQNLALNLRVTNFINRLKTNQNLPPKLTNSFSKPEDAQ